MTTKRLFALLVAVLMLVTLFSACADDSGNDDANQPADSGNASDAGSTGGSGNDEPTESEPYRLTYRAVRRISGLTPWMRPRLPDLSLWQLQRADA